MADPEREVRIAARQAARRSQPVGGASGELGASGSVGSMPVSGAGGASGAGSSTTGAARVAESLTGLDTIKTRTIEHVTAVRLDAERGEAERRREEEERRQDRLWRLHEEADVSGKANAAIEMHWEDLNDYNMPQELFKEMQAQRKACEAVIASKDALIREFQAELRAKDEEYVKALQQQREGVEELLRRMDAQYGELQAQYEAELAAIESAFEQERAELVRRQREEAGALLSQRAEAETRYTQERLAAEKQYAQELDAIQASDAEDFAKLKTKLETDAQTLQQQLAVMRAVYLLNTEKLEYNYRVLTEQSQDNDAASAAERAKVKRLEAALTKVTSEYKEADRRHRARNTALTVEFARITRQFQDLQTKAGHFSAADKAKFEEVWALHDGEAAALTDRVLAADRVIHEQILGWRWEAPAERPVRPLPPSIDAASIDVSPSGGNGGGGGGGGGDESDGRRLKGPSDLPADVTEACELLEHGDDELVEEGQRLRRAMVQHKQDADAVAAEGDEAQAEALSAEEETMARLQGVQDALQRRARMRCVLRAVVDEAGFMLAGAASASGPGAGVDRESEPAKAAAAVLWQLGVRTVEDMYSIAEALAGPEGATAIAGAEAGDDGAGGSVASVGGAGADGAESAAVAAAAAATSKLDGLQVGAADVVPVLRVWAEEKAKAGSGGLDEPGSATGFVEEEEGGSVASHSGVGHAVTAAATGAGGGVVGSGGGGGDSGRGDTSGKASLTSAEVAYWRAVADAVPDGTVRVWTALEASLQKHLSALRSRAGLLDDVDELRAQNDQLRGVLAQYLRADVNKELAFPPAATARLAGGV